MRRTTLALALAAFCTLATLAHAAIFHHNVDLQTLPGGPVELVTLSPTDFDGGLNQYTFHFGAKNNVSYTEEDVLFLLQFVFDPTDPYVFNDGADSWSANGNTLSFPGLSVYSMTDTDAPLSWTKPQGTGTLLASDTVPYVQIGDIPGATTIPFDLVVQVNAGFNNFDVVASFVAVPEPSTLALLGVGVIGVLGALRRRRK